ncbi:MAG TPA: 2,3-bisphosphoglycerate-dependent phosphoglycerate mutase [Candidatus Saccharibacteria bacterium]|jgi:2,3-bisphosphoglycerate-dependent phosphoglycerate mutase|nr:2,3-bisphosphoglycerate-dependent phosphoglycerate mutase [Candidatus Saccharibacteria bacterium]HMR37999.1 2,3-bisphosphoglycerate-dependent phosphoglycerate mutase [Candidatus Saccharibacteria bacterium]
MNEPTKGILVLIRHAESEWNALGKWTGVTDVHLSETGYKQAEIFGDTITDIRFDEAFCSEQTRAFETLQGILKASDQQDILVTRNGAINERDYGDYTGMNKFEVRDEIGEEAFNAIRRGWDTPIPHGETLKDVYSRSVPYFKEVILPKLQRGENILIVAHGNSLRSLIKHLENVSDDGVAGLEMDFGKFVIYQFDENGQIVNREERQAAV